MLTNPQFSEFPQFKDSFIEFLDSFLTVLLFCPILVCVDTARYGYSTHERNLDENGIDVPRAVDLNAKESVLVFFNGF